MSQWGVEAFIAIALFGVCLAYLVLDRKLRKKLKKAKKKLEETD